MATKKSIAGDQLGKLWTGSTTNTPQPLYITVTDAAKGSKVIAITTVQLFGTTNYFAVSREFVKEQLANTVAKSSAGNQLILDSRYAAVSLDTLALASELSTLQINAWSDATARSANNVTDLGIAANCTAKIGFPKYNHGAEIVGFDYDDAKKVEEKTPAQLAADAAADAKAKRNKMLLMGGAVLVAGALIWGFVTDWKFGKKNKKKDK